MLNCTWLAINFPPKLFHISIKYMWKEFGKLKYEHSCITNSHSAFTKLSSWFAFLEQFFDPVKSWLILGSCRVHQKEVWAWHWSQLPARYLWFLALFTCLAISRLLMLLGLIAIPVSLRLFLQPPTHTPPILSTPRLIIC